MTNAALGWTNAILTGSLTAGASAPASGPGWLQDNFGGTASAWQTPLGIVTASDGAWLICDAGSAQTFQAFLLCRTNLTPAATVRWRVGPLAALVEIPPTLNVDFQQETVTLPAGWNFSRAGTATYIAAAGGMASAAPNVPRYGYDIATLLPLGLMLEEARANLLTNAQAGITGGVAPNTNAASSDIAALFTGAIVNKSTRQGTGDNDCGAIGATTTAASVYSMSVFVYVPTSFTGGMVQITGDATLTGSTFVNADLTKTGQWQQISCTGTAAGSSASMALRVTGNPGDVVYSTCPQFELGPQPSSYIPTTAGAVARAADYAWITIASIGAACTLLVDIDGAMGIYSAVGLGIGYNGNTSGDSTYVGWGSPALTNTFGEFLSGGVNYAPQFPLAFSGSGKIALAIDSSSVILAGASGSAAELVSGGTLPSHDNWLTFGAYPFDSGIARGINFVRRFAYWNQKLSFSQVAALGLDGTTCGSTSGPTYDSRIVYDSLAQTGVVAAYNQHVWLPPSPVSGQCCRADIDDPANPDNFLSIPLAYAGPLWSPQVNYTFQTSAFGRDDKVAEVTTRGGQEYPLLQWQRRRWDARFDGLQDAEIGPYIQELDRIARAGGNVLFVPDTAGANIAQDAVFGRLKTKTDVGYSALSKNARSWTTTVTERL